MSTPGAAAPTPGTALATGGPATAGESALAPVIEARGLSVGHGGVALVPGIDVTVAPRSSLALVGTNGSGKSTLLRTLVGLLPGLGGTLEVLGTRPGGAPRRLAYVGQAHASGFVLPLRSVDVVRMGRYPDLGLFGRMRSEDHDLIEAAMTSMGVAGLARAPLRSLSGGQQQRIYLAQALARRADLIVLDEPTSGLDAGGRELYLQAFAAEMARGAAIVTATHDISEAVEYDQVMLLARRVVALGPGSEVLTADRLLATFGILLRDPHAEHAQRFVVAEVTHGAPQVIDVGPEPAP